MTISFFDRVENNVGKGENAGYQHFLLFPQCFPKPPSLGSSKVGIMWLRVKSEDNPHTATELIQNSQIHYILPPTYSLLFLRYGYFDIPTVEQLNPWICR